MSLAVALLCGAVGAAVALLATRQRWSEGTATVAGGPFPLTAKGSDVTGVPASLAIVGLAARVAVFAVRRTGRCMVAGLLALSGAPKPRAMQIIDELEPSRRGLYGGCVGYLDFAGDSDTAIAIRTALLREGTAYVQAGAGIVADSDPVAEDTECRNKAAAVLRAVHTANRLG